MELQNDLIALDDSKADGDTVEAQSIINACSPREAKYLLEHLLDMVLNLVSVCACVCVSTATPPPPPSQYTHRV